MTYANLALPSVVGLSWERVAGRADAEWPSNSAEAVEKVCTGPHGRRVFLCTKAPMRDADGMVSDLIGVSTDITEHDRVEEQRTLLIHKMNRRVKNTLATVRGIAQHALRGVAPALRRVFEARSIALSAAHDVLTLENWKALA